MGRGYGENSKRHGCNESAHGGMHLQSPIVLHHEDIQDSEIIVPRVLVASALNVASRRLLMAACDEPLLTTQR